MIAEAGSRKKGLATEAARLMMSYAAKHLSATSIVAKITDGNDASNAMFKKMGFDLEGHE